MTPAYQYVEACREVLRWSQEAHQAAQRGQWEAVLAHLLARQRAMDAADRLPVSATALQAVRAQALPLLAEAQALNRRLLDRVRRLHDLLRPVVGTGDGRFLDTYR